MYQCRGIISWIPFGTLVHGNSCSPAAAQALQRADVRHLYICDFHKSFIQSVRNKRKRKGSDDDGGDSPDHDAESPEVDLFQLQVNTLRRYKRHFKLQTRPGLNKAQLAETISRHFRTIPVNEKETLAYFIYMVKNEKMRHDQKSDSSIH
ncbi:histone deacetylase complex subunit SAP30L isoform X2 [Hemiscyllium ocellatum]|uniref:histone deacetylase complex subunit SAP30L isoform X2 n=1 Tax=Hemiscyllium ocellatum TaxID=170820 RepID=UPI002966E276|nr:histone deacetylase complex subunit SAP30L isoform X2 [Hemiscyllium ocellatum]